MDIDSDESIAKGAIEYGSKKRIRSVVARQVRSKMNGLSASKRTKLNDSATGGVIPNESFVAVQLDKITANVSRIYLD